MGCRKIKEKTKISPSKINFPSWVGGVQEELFVCFSSNGSSQRLQTWENQSSQPTSRGLNSPET